MLGSVCFLEKFDLHTGIAAFNQHQTYFRVACISFWAMLEISHFFLKNVLEGKEHFHSGSMAKAKGQIQRLQGGKERKRRSMWHSFPLNL